MVKKRIIPTLLWDDFGCVKGRGFKPDRRIGPMMQAVRVMERRQIDELVILDIAATPAGRGPRFEEIKEFTGEMSCPVTVGGGIRSVEDAVKLLAAGADKVAICTAYQSQFDLVHKASRVIGSQSIVVAIDCKSDKFGWSPYVRCGTFKIDYSVRDWAMAAQEQGAGEILLTSIDRDGTLEGYDHSLIAEVANNAGLSIPVIANGGCSGPEDMEQAFHLGADAVAAGALFLFTEATPRYCAQYLHKMNIPVRIPPPPERLQ